MRAMVLERAGEPLRPAELPDPRLDAGQVLISVGACGVCRTDLHIVDGELDRPKPPLALGHQIAGRGARVGAGWARRGRGGSASSRGSGWVFPGWDGPAASVATAFRGARTSAT